MDIEELLGHNYITACKYLLYQIPLRLAHGGRPADPQVAACTLVQRAGSKAMTTKPPQPGDDGSKFPEPSSRCGRTGLTEKTTVRSEPTKGATLPLPL